MIVLLARPVFYGATPPPRGPPLRARGPPPPPVSVSQTSEQFLVHKLGVKSDHKTFARDFQAPLRATKLEPSCRVGAAAALPMRPRNRPSGIFKQSILSVGRLSVVLQHEAPAGARDCRRSIGLQEPV